MASNYPKYLLSSVMAAKGDSTIPPATASEAGEGRLSQENGWGAETSTPLEQGGVAPRREDFNGMTLLFSQFLLWYQQGGLMNYSSKLPYEAGNEVLLNGVKYRAIQNNGGTLAAVVPGTDPTVWRNMDANVPAGAVMPFANVRLGGSDGRRPIFWGATQADEGWVLCDGGTAYGSVKAPNLIGKFIRGDSVANAGGTGGANSVTLSAAQMPKHTHTITVTTSGGAHPRARNNGNYRDGYSPAARSQLWRYVGRCVFHHRLRRRTHGRRKWTRLVFSFEFPGFARLDGRNHKCRFTRAYGDVLCSGW